MVALSTSNRINLWKGRILLNLTDLGTIQMPILIIFTFYGMILSTQRCFHKRFNLWSIHAQSTISEPYTFWSWIELLHELGTDWVWIEHGLIPYRSSLIQLERVIKSMFIILSLHTAEWTPRQLFCMFPYVRPQYNNTNYQLCKPK